MVNFLRMRILWETMQLSALESDEEPIVVDLSDENTDHDAVTDSYKNYDGVQDSMSKAGFSWRNLSHFKRRKDNCSHKTL